MEKNLNQLLSKDHARTTKQNLNQIINGMYELMGADEFKKIMDIDPAELKDLDKKELTNIVKQINDVYDSNWEKQLSQATQDTQKYFDSFIDLSSMLLDQEDRQFSASNASNANFAAELGSIDFANLIGGPLNACVTAQSNASMSTVSFIESVAFNDDNELRMVNFSHKKVTLNPNFGKDPANVPDGTNVLDETFEESIILEVPFISMMNIPSLRIETCEIDFHVKLNSVYTKDISSDLELKKSSGLELKWVKFDVSASYQRSVSTGVKVEKEYTMGVKVVATNDQLPGGLENLLGILAG